MPDRSKSSEYFVSACAWITYGATRNLTLFLVVNIVEGLAVAWSYPAKAAFLVQVVPPRWLGTVQGLESTSVQVAALVGTLTAPFLYRYLSGYVICVAGGLSLVGLSFAGPILYRAWRRLVAEREGAAAVAWGENAARGVALPARGSGPGTESLLSVQEDD